MAKQVDHLQPYENLEQKAEQKLEAREKKFSKPEMVVTGKGAFALQRLVQKSQGTRIVKQSFKSKKSIETCLAEEIINAYRLSNASNAISKKLEVERQADSSR